MKFQFNDGGRAAAGYKGNTGDCVCSAIAIAADLPYQEVYDRLAKGNGTQKKTKRGNKAGFTAAKGINVKRQKGVQQFTPTNTPLTNYQRVRTRWKTGMGGRINQIGVFTDIG